MDNHFRHPIENDPQTENVNLPSMEELEMQLEWEKQRSRRFRRLRTILFSLIAAVAVVVVVLVLWMPTLQINGKSMEPQLTAGDIVLTKKVKDVAPGDVVVFYYDDKILVKRLIGSPGDWIDIDKDGDVYVNGELLEEPYVAGKALGECDIALPYHEPEDKLFVMGDYRSESIDSRYSVVGCIDRNQIIGKLVFKIWPLGEIGTVK